MKIFLLATNTDREPYPVYPLGMAVIAQALFAAGHEVRQVDYLAMGESEDALRTALLEFQPQVVGLSLRNIDDVDSCGSPEQWFLDRSRRIVELLRATHDVPIIVGGPAFSIMPEAILEYLDADFGVAGEGERAILDLLSRIERGEAGPRIVKSTPLDATGMRPPRMDPVILAYYQRESGLPGVHTKRGCPHDCVYCSYPAIEGRAIRPRDPEHVADDMAELAGNHGVDHVFFTDSVFNDDQGHYLAVAEALLRRNLPVRWSAFFRPGRIRDAELDLLLRSGLLGMEVGSDALAEATLAGLGKGFCCSDVLRFNAACAARDIPLAHYLIIGGPEESEATIKETLANLEKMEHCVAFIYSGLRILPRTRLHKRAVAEGLIDRQTSLLHPAYYHSPLLDREVMHATVSQALRGRRDRFFPPRNAQDRMNVMRRFGYRGLVWDQLISAEKQRRGKNGNGRANGGSSKNAFPAASPQYSQGCPKPAPLIPASDPCVVATQHLAGISPFEV
jgi:lipid biosynthesis B12-binding/radical SAM protein